MAFEKDFLFGTATAAYQIEGGVSEDGRSASIWDTFCTMPGKIFGGESGLTACDSYHLYEEDIKLIKELGTNAYRFSISWPRIFPARGKYNYKGMEYYKKLISLLRDNGIIPVVTIYHWDLPQWLQDMGGWAGRDSVDCYCEFAKKCFDELNGMVEYWITLNEPFCSAFLGYISGVHAPGHRSIYEGMAAAHHLLLGHGRTVDLFREGKYKGKIGITLNLTPHYPADGSFLNRLAVNNADGYHNRWFLYPVFKADYPADMLNLFSAHVPDMNFIKEGDLQLMCREMDFLGVNYYSGATVEYCPVDPFRYSRVYTSLPKTDMGWDITPEALKDLIRTLRREYTGLPIIITENGSAWKDIVDETGRIHDISRIDYMEKHLKVIDELNMEGQNITGYFVWTLMDNFEWAFGTSKRFGLAYTDYRTQKRIPKDSFYRYRDIIKKRRV